MKLPKPTTIDFETFGIESRPKYPPIPVGVSIKPWGKKAVYYGWGHPTDNNCSWSEAEAALKEAYQCPDGLLFQHAKFDLDVAEVHFGLPIPSWERIYDTMLLLFLDDPHQTELGLKPSAARLLDWDPEEQDAVGEWLVEHQPVPGVKISRSKNSPHYFGRYIAFAPGKLVGKYANGDVDRTAALFKLLYPRIVERGMIEADNRERRLLPILLEMERQGVPVDLPRLRRDVATYTEWRDRATAWILKRIQADDGLNLDSGVQLMNAMVASGKVDPSLVPLTKTGKLQTNKEALTVGVTDKILLAMLTYRTQLSTCLNTFMIPWLRVAEQSGGCIYTTWNQVKSPAGGGSIGTRTGRLSSTPNFQNIPKTFEPIFAHDVTDQGRGRKLPKCPFKDLPRLPQVRSYVVPFKGHALIDRDYSQQEPRILAHFDGGALMDKYLEDPWIDFHDYAKAELARMGLHYERRPVKDTNLGLIYGMGVGKLAMKTGLSVDETSDLKKAVLSLYPGLREMYRDMKVRAKTNKPIRTWGGREYYCEPPKLVNGRIREFDYKLVNVLIQGSAADCTKEAIIRVWEKLVELGQVGNWFIVLQVHDQLTMSVPKRDVRKAMEMLRECMESVEFDVPILSEGSISHTNWGGLKDYDAKGCLI